MNKYIHSTVNILKSFKYKIRFNSLKKSGVCKENENTQNRINVSNDDTQLSDECTRN